MGDKSPKAKQKAKKQVTAVKTQKKGAAELKAGASPVEAVLKKGR